MKSLILTISSLAALVASNPDHFQTVPSIICTDPPTQTVTVTQDCAVCQTGIPGSGGSGGSGASDGSGGGAGVTVTITETVTTTLSPVTLTTSTSKGKAVSSTTSGVTAQQTFHVDVGAFSVDGTNETVVQFRPNNITDAHVGDVVLFNMLGANHSVTRSQFPQPCIKNGTFDTGFVPNPKNHSDYSLQSFTVNVTTPLWFYCRQTGHCGKGMVFGINPKSQEQMQQFIDMAMAQNGTASNSTSGNGTSTSTSGSIISTSTAPFATITVGTGNGTNLVFDPPNLPSVPPHSTVRFEFHAKNHTLTESSFGAPCSKLDSPSAVDTGFANFNKLDVAPFSTFDVAVEDASPRFFYCKQTVAKSHCQAGMVFGLNVEQNMFAEFQQKAEGSAVPPAPEKRAAGRRW